MSNGVEVIVAANKSSRTMEPEFLRFLMSTVTRPITLAPHTLTNLMSMVLSTEHITDEHNRLIALIRPTFTTKTFFTTYNYRTTTLKNDSTVVTNAKVAITNTQTVPRCKVTETNEIEPTKTVFVTLDASPTLKTEVYNTEYTYLNTFLDGEQPLVVSSTQTISNTLVGLGDNVNDLEPSEVFPSTNTYLKTVELTKSLTDGTDHHIISTSDVVTQVVVTHKPTKRSTQVPITTNVTKTYFVTYTYFSTYLEGDRTKVKSDVSVSSDVTIEKFYIKPKKTDEITFQRFTNVQNAEKESSAMTFPFNLLATRTYLTTFTYFTTLLHGTDKNSPQTRTNSHTKVVENTVTETIPYDEFNTDYLLRLNGSFQKVSDSVVVTATLKKGERILVTAQRDSPLKSFYQKYEIKPTLTKDFEEYQTEWSQLQSVEDPQENIEITRTQNLMITPTESMMGNEPQAEALTGADEEEEQPNGGLLAGSPVTTKPPSLGLVENGKNDYEIGFEGDSLDVSNDAQEETSVVDDENEEPPITVTQTAEKNADSNQTANQTNANNLLNLNSFGINGMNVLGPVFNAMAELINHKINKNGEGINHRNETAAHKPEKVVKEPSTSNVNPILNFVNKFTSAPTKTPGHSKTKSTTPRTPVYIPVGSFGQETEVVENQNRRVLITNGPDVHAKNSDKMRPHDGPVTILEGGIPISPGQVITTNSDVIIGTPGESGPRPPTFALKNDIPVDMKPPPAPPNLISVKDGDHFIGQASASNGVNIHFVKDELNVNLPSSVPKKQIYEAQNVKMVRPYPNGHKEHKSEQHHRKNPNVNSHLKYDSDTLDLNPPPVPPPPPKRIQEVHKPLTINHKPVHESSTDDHPYSEHDLDQDHGHGVHPIPIGLVQNYLSPSELKPTLLTFPTVPLLSPINYGTTSLASTSTPNLGTPNVESLFFVPTTGDTSINPNVMDGSTGHPFLVNIQPSQVANVVIPHGSSTALIVNEEKQHSLKGEVIDDPSPHPEPETVGFVGAAPVLRLENDDVTVPLQNEVIPAETVDVFKTSLHANSFFLPDQPQLPINGLKNQEKPIENAFLKNEQYSLVQNPFANLANPQFAHQAPQINHQSSLTLGHHQQHRLTPINEIGIQKIQNHKMEDENFGSHVLDDVKKSNGHNHGKETEQTDVIHNYRKEPNLNSGPVLFDNYQSEKNGFGGSSFQQIQNGFGSVSQNQQLNIGEGVQTKLKQEQILEKVPEAAYQLPKLSHQEGFDVGASAQNQPFLKETVLNHEAGIVTDISLSHGATHPDLKAENHPLKDLLIKHNSQHRDSVSIDPKKGPQFFESPSTLKRPINDFDQDLSPPPPPRLTFLPPVPPVPPHPMTFQKVPPKYRPHFHPARPPVPMPLEFMIPPPESPSRKKIKPQPEQTRPLIPIGAMAPVPQSPQKRPDGIGIVPHENQPESIATKQKHRIPGTPQVYFDLDVSDTSVSMEKEEDLQGSVPQPMFPGHVINDVKHPDKNTTNDLSKHQTQRPQRLPANEDKTHNPVNKNDGKPEYETSVKIKNDNSGTSNQTPTNHWSVNQKIKSTVKVDSYQHGTTSADQTFENHKKDEGSKHHQTHSGHKSSSNTSNHREWDHTFDPLKVLPGRRHPSGTVLNVGSHVFGINKHGNVTHPGTVVRVPKPNFYPSGFIKQDNRFENKPSVSTSPVGQTTGAVKGTVDVKIEPVNHQPTRIEADSNSAFFGLKNKQTDLLKNHQQTPKKPTHVSEISFKEPSSGGEGDTINGQNKKPQRYGSTNHQTHDVQSQPDANSSKNFSRPHHGAGSQLVRPIKNPVGVQPPTKSNKTKVSLTQSTSINNFTRNTDANVQKRPYLPFESFGHGKTPTKHPSGYQQPPKDVGQHERGEASTTEVKNVTIENAYLKPPVVPENPPSSYGHGKEPVHPVPNTNQNYGNRTNNFYDSKSAFEFGKVHNNHNNRVTFDSDKRFVANFSSSNSKNINNYYNNSKTNSINGVASGENHRNTIQTGIKASIPPDAQIALMPPPPKIPDSKTKVVEVMGLSPPPLERPRRPPPLQRPQRPKPHHKFDGSITSKPPIPIENDFPPVRSPDFNRKPFKPQDIFPPRLPDNFVHHLPEYPPTRGPPKPRPIEKPVTSLQIDIPTSEKTVKPSRPYGGITYDTYDFEDSSGDDPYFAGSEINGHSKPIHAEATTSVKKPQSGQSGQSGTNGFNRPKTGQANKSSDSVQQTSPVKVSDRTKPNPTDLQAKSNASRYHIRDKISPTPAISAQTPTTKSTETKTTTSVTSATTRPYKKWQETEIVTGSETTLEPDRFNHHVTPDMIGGTKRNEIVTSVISTGSTTIFDHRFTQPPMEKSVSTAASNVNSNSEIRPVIVPTRTTTLTVTTTMTTVVHSVGREPSTKTVVLTKTLISTVINKVTETTTLVKPTTSTLFETHTISTVETPLVVPTVIYPSQTKHQPEGTMKPEIFMAVPHAKDTMTISVSSSMNKNGQNVDQKPRPVGVTGKDSIMVVVSNEQSQENFSGEDVEDEDDLDDKIEVSDEENEVIHSRVMVGGVFDAEVDKEFKESTNKEDECFPGCKAKRNELCQRIKGIMKCVCRPGFARMFPDRPCRPTYTYEVKLALEKLGPDHIHYGKNVAQANSAHIAKLTSITKEGLDRMIMQSELRDVYHGIVVNGFQGKEKTTMVDFYVQLSENTDEKKLVDIIKQTLQTSNYSLGGTELFAAKEADNLNAEDFNECLNPKYHDCSEHARCFNLKGTYTCSCKEGYTDMSENTVFPGRVCSDAIGCEYCGYHGVCYSKGEGQMTCECFQWYSGERCNINLKVLLIALATIGVILLALLMICGVLTCLNRRNKTSPTGKSNGYLRYRGPSSHSVDRRAMISDSSSESSVDNLPYLSSPPMPKSDPANGKKKPVLRHIKGPVPRPLPPPGLEQRDRTVTVMIPRAKYRSPPHLSSHLTMSTFSPEKHLPKPAGPSATEQKLISYLDGNTREERTIANHKSSGSRQEGEQSKSYDFKITSASVNDVSKTIEKKKELRGFEYEYKISNMSFSEETNSAERRSGKSGEDRFRRHSDFTNLQSDASRIMQFRKYSAGALVSAGYEVSAKVGMHQLDDDTLDDDQSAVTNTHTMKSNRSEFTTLNRTGDHKTMSEARSYDETTVHPQTRSLKTNYSGSSPSSRANNDESHTMIERDLGSTFILPKSQLFKPDADRGSDISNFDSL